MLGRKDAGHWGELTRVTVFVGSRGSGELVSQLNQQRTVRILRVGLNHCPHGPPSCGLFFPPPGRGTGSPLPDINEDTLDKMCFFESGPETWYLTPLWV